MGLNVGKAAVTRCHTNKYLQKRFERKHSQAGNGYELNIARSNLVVYSTHLLLEEELTRSDPFSHKKTFAEEP